MKCAEANTRLSFVTATLNCLWAATPPSFQQYHVNGRAGQVRRGAGVQGVGLVPELTIERGDGIPSCHRPDPSDIQHRAGAALYPMSEGSGRWQDGMPSPRSIVSSGTR